MGCTNVVDVTVEEKMCNAKQDKWQNDVEHVVSNTPVFVGNINSLRQTNKWKHGVIQDHSVTESLRFNYNNKSPMMPVVPTL